MMLTCPSKVGRPLTMIAVACVCIYIGSTGWGPNWSQAMLREAGGVLVIEDTAGASASAAPPIRQCPDAFRDYVSAFGSLLSDCTHTGNLLVRACYNLCHMASPEQSPMELELRRHLCCPIARSENKTLDKLVRSGKQSAPDRGQLQHTGPLWSIATKSQTVCGHAPLLQCRQRLQEPAMKSLQRRPCNESAAWKAHCEGT